MSSQANGRIVFSKIFDDDFCRELESRKLFLITTQKVSEILDVKSMVDGKHLDYLIVEVPDGEEQKSISVYKGILDRLAEEKFPRDGVIIGIGGGATTDLAGFVAATWMRGIDWIAIPTTLAAMVDAAIGGKTGINLDSGKNLVGSFHLPTMTVIDHRLLSTLDDRDLSAGMAEVIKCGMIADPQILELAERTSIDALARGEDQETLDLLIQKSVAVKDRIVSRDLRENGDRAFLNYGHTLGHAIEVAKDFQLRHGEAVSMGMIYAASLSGRFLDLGDEVIQRQKDLLLRYRLPVTLHDLDFEALLSIMQRDKKVKSGKMRFVLLKDVGHPILVDSLEHDLLASVFNELSQSA
ncbi:MAG: 3-dehydroquinate synthase [Candidatus Nanopelagicaceae bacterium]